MAAPSGAVQMPSTPREESLGVHDRVLADGVRVATGLAQEPEHLPPRERARARAGRGRW